MIRTLPLVAVATLCASAGSASAVHVNLELSLLVDVSDSISTTEYNLQKLGYANAFRQSNFFNSVIGSGNSIAVNFIEWSSGSQQAELVGWTLINSQASATAFGDSIAATGRPFSDNTAPGSAINFAFPRMFNNSFTSDKQVIDVSGDGVANSGANTANARAAALAAGVDQINGLVIGGSNTVLNWYIDNVQGGEGSFVLTAANFEAFQGALVQKLQMEISQGIPLPTTAGLAGLGLVVVGSSRRRARP